MKIKPVENIKSVFNEKKDLEECLEEQMKAFEKERENITHMEELIKAMLSRNITIHKITAGTGFISTGESIWN